MSIVGQQHLVQVMKWAGRVIAISEVFLLLLALLIFYVFSEAGVNISLMGAAIVIILASFIMSLWRTWLAGILLIVNLIFLTYILEFSVDVFTVAAIYFPIFLSGVLFLLAWWFSRKTNSTKTPPS